MIAIHNRRRRILADVVIASCPVVHPLPDPVESVLFAKGTVSRYTGVDGGVITANIPGTVSAMTAPSQE
jgi:hypothetical protein